MKSTLFAITLNTITLGFLVLIPKMKAAINPMSIINNKIMSIHIFLLGNNLTMKKTNSAAISTTLQHIVQADKRRLSHSCFLS